MSKHDDNEDKRRRRFIGWFFGPLALAGLFAVLGFILGNATAHSAMGADNTNVLAQPVVGCLDTDESATYLAASYRTNAEAVNPSTSDSTSQANTDGTNLGTAADAGIDSVMSFDALITDNGDGAGITPASDITPNSDPIVDPTPTPDPTTQSGDDCDHEGHGEHQDHGDHEGDNSHSEGEHQSADC